MTKVFVVGTLFLLIVSSVPLTGVGSHSQEVKQSAVSQYEQYKESWYVKGTADEPKNNVVHLPVVFNEKSTTSNNGPMDSPWPMQSHDVHHTGLSQYSTANNLGAEIWRIHGDRAGGVESSAVIDNDGIIYFGTKGSDSALYALYPNGTRKWRFHANGLIWGTPALADNGDIYCTTWGGYEYLQAITKNGTERWRFDQESGSVSSPTIGEDGTIYFGTDGYKIFAVNPDGAEKWRYTTGYIVMASPAIGNDDTIYVGSGDHYLYSMYPNGTLRWQFVTSGEIKGSASIATDGTIYVPSFDGYLYALYPNGTMKWRASTGDSIAAAGVALASDGTIYVGTEQLRAYYPNGTLKWCTNLQGSIYGTVPAVSADGTIYVSAGVSLVAINPDGTEKWRQVLTTQDAHSSPSIAEDGTVYVGSTNGNYGYLHAFGIGPLWAEAYGPYKGAMTQPLQFSGMAFGGTPPYMYSWEFGDGTTSEEQNPTHTYAHRGNYTAVLTVTDTTGNRSNDTAQVEIGYPLPKITIIKPVSALYVFNVKICPYPFPLIIGRITIIVNASQVDAGIDRVEFYYDGKLKYTDRSPPYRWVWTGHPPPFDQDLMVRAIDTRGNHQDHMISITKLF